jgi:hypothetical protein
MAPTEAAVWLRHLVGFVLADYSDRYGLRHLAVYLPRQAVGVSWAIDRVLVVCAGTARQRNLPEHRAALHALLGDAVRQ